MGIDLFVWYMGMICFGLLIDNSMNLRMDIPRLSIANQPYMHSIISIHRVMVGDVVGKFSNVIFDLHS